MKREAAELDQIDGADATLLRSDRLPLGDVLHDAGHMAVVGYPIEDLLRGPRDEPGCAEVARRYGLTTSVPAISS